MKKFVVDRIEGEYAVCLDEKNRSTDFKLDKIGFAVKEGLFILYDDNLEEFYLDNKETEKVYKENETRLKGLFGRKNN